MKLKEITDYLDNYLRIGEIEDVSQNGLQVSCQVEINKAVFAVDASLEVFEKANEADADIIIVHHGLFWGNPFLITDINYDRIAYLIKNDMALYAAHLPLDMHPEVGNNAQLAEALGLVNLEEFGDYHGETIGIKGDLKNALEYNEFLEELRSKFNKDFLDFHFGRETIKSIGIISGGGSSMLKDARDAGVDLFFSGETGHSSYHTMKEYKLNAVFGGHYFTETFGVKALGQLLTEKFKLDTEFLDSPTGL